MSEQKVETHGMLVGGFSPYTKAHHENVKQMLGGGHASVNVFATQSSRRPISAEKKVDYIKTAAGEGVNVNTTLTPFHAAAQLHAEGKRGKLVLYGGSDRAPIADRLREYNGKEGKHGYYNFEGGIEFRQVGGERKEGAKGLAGISGTAARKAKNPQELKKFIPKELHSRAEEIFNDMNESINPIGIFLLGGPGSGKDYVLKNIFSRFDLTEVQADHVLNGTAGELVAEGKNIVINGALDEEKIQIISSILENYNLDTVYVSVTNKVSRLRNSLRENPLSENKRLEKWYRSEKMIESLEDKFVFNNSINLNESSEMERVFFANQIEKLLERLIGHGLVMKEEPAPQAFTLIREKKFPAVRKKYGMPAKYSAGLSKSTALARKRHWAKANKLSDSDPEAYKPAPGDATAKTKPSKHTLAVRKMMGEEMVVEGKADKSLAAKAEKSGISLSTLRKVYRRGVAAWNSGHRPGTTPSQWGHARVNSYINKGKTYHTADKDLREDMIDERLRRYFTPMTPEEENEYNTLLDIELASGKSKEEAEDAIALRTGLGRFNLGGGGQIGVKWTDAHRDNAQRKANRGTSTIGTFVKPSVTKRVDDASGRTDTAKQRINIRDTSITRKNPKDPVTGRPQNVLAHEIQHGLASQWTSGRGYGRTQRSTGDDWKDYMTDPNERMGFVAGDMYGRSRSERKKTPWTRVARDVTDKMDAAANEPTSGKANAKDAVVPFALTEPKFDDFGNYKGVRSTIGSEKKKEEKPPAPAPDADAPAPAAPKYGEKGTGENKGKFWTGSSWKKPSEMSDEERYGKTGAAIRRSDPEAYKKRDKTAAGNLELLKKLNTQESASVESNLDQLFEMQLVGTDEYRIHAIAMTPGQNQEIEDVTKTMGMDVSAKEDCDCPDESDCGCDEPMPAGNRKSFRQFRAEAKETQVELPPTADVTPTLSKLKPDNSKKTPAKPLRAAVDGMAITSRLTGEGYVGQQGTELRAATVAKTVGTNVAKKAIPVIGSVYNAVDAYDRVKKGDYTGAAISAAGVIPALSTPSAVLNVARDEGLFDTPKQKQNKEKKISVREEVEIDEASIKDIVRQGVRAVRNKFRPVRGVDSPDNITRTPPIRPDLRDVNAPSETQSNIDPRIARRRSQVQVSNATREAERNARSLEQIRNDMRNVDFKPQKTVGQRVTAASKKVKSAVSAATPEPVKQIGKGAATIGRGIADTAGAAGSAVAAAARSPVGKAAIRTGNVLAAYNLAKDAAGAIGSDTPEAAAERQKRLDAQEKRTRELTGRWNFAGDKGVSPAASHATYSTLMHGTKAGEKTKELASKWSATRSLPDPFTAAATVGLAATLPGYSAADTAADEWETLKKDTKYWWNKITGQKTNEEVELIKEAVEYHLSEGISFTENAFRPGSEMFFEMINIAKDLYKEGAYKPADEWEKDMLNSNIGERAIFEGREVILDYPFQEELEEEVMQLDEVFDAVYPHQYHGTVGPSDTGDHVYSFYVPEKGTSNHHTYSVSITNGPGKPGSKTGNLSFDYNGRQPKNFSPITGDDVEYLRMHTAGDVGITGKGGGKASSVISTVKAIAQKHAIKHGLSSIEFSGNMYEPSRIKLYDRIARRFGGKELGQENEDDPHIKYSVPVKEGSDPTNGKGIGKPWREGGGGAVYVRDGDSIRKIRFSQSGMKKKYMDPARVRSFVARHHCLTNKDKTSASYWACRWPRFFSNSGKIWW